MVKAVREGYRMKLGWAFGAALCFQFQESELFPSDRDRMNHNHLRPFAVLLFMYAKNKDVSRAQSTEQ
jgi:hypothetical protein